MLLHGEGIWTVINLTTTDSVVSLEVYESGNHRRWSSLTTKTERIVMELVVADCELCRYRAWQMMWSRRLVQFALYVCMLRQSRGASAAVEVVREGLTATELCISGLERGRKWKQRLTLLPRPSSTTSCQLRHMLIASTCATYVAASSAPRPC